MAQEIVTIRPKKDSRRFRTVGGNISQLYKTSEDGKEEERNMGNFKGERFPNSRQMFRVSWSSSKSQWKLKGFETVNEEKQKELNELAKACKFKYQKDHPNQGKYIETADIYDPADPFFSHKDLKIISQEGEILLNKARPIDKIILAALMADSQFAVGGENLNPMTSSRVKYIITDKTIDTKMKKEVRSKKLKAIKLLDNLTSAKKIKIALAIGAISNPDIDLDTVEELLFEWAEDSSTKVANNMTRQDFFIHMCETGNEELELRTLISAAKSAGILKKQKNSGFLLFGEKLGKTEKHVFDYLSNDDNQDMILRIETAIQGKTNG